MIPQVQDELRQDFALTRLPGRTFRMLHERRRVAGTIDERRALEQAIFLILHTERYAWLIHSWNYGVEFRRLIGQDPAYCVPEIERAVREALLQDDRITEVRDFAFEIRKKTVRARFTACTIYGPIETELEVPI